MRRLYSKYFFATYLVCIALCATLAAKGCGRVIAAQLPPAIAGTMTVQLPSTLPQSGEALGAPGSDKVSAIVKRNIFCSTCEPQSPDEPKQSGDGADSANNDVAAGPVASTLTLKVLATLVSHDDPRWSFAAIEDTTSNTSGLYSIGTEVAANVVVTDIMERRVLLQNNHRVEYIDLEGPADGQGGEGTAQAAAPPPGGIEQVTPTDEMRDLAQGIRKVGGTIWEIQRSTLNKALNNTHMIARSARVVPSMTDGKPDGFKLYGVRVGSFYSLLGMFNGDTINAVNGHPIDTPDKALEVYTQLRSASNVALTFTRQGVQLTHTYNIR